MDFLNKSGLSEEHRNLKIKSINNRFKYHPPFGDQVERYTMIRSLCGILSLKLLDLCPESREKILMYEKLDEVVFWANASIARGESQ
jgi:hypothetical protein